MHGYGALLPHNWLINFSVGGPNVSDSNLDASLSGVKMSRLDLHTISDIQKALAASM